MTIAWKQRVCRSALILATLALFGCSSAQKTIPHFGFGSMDVEARLDRDDMIVLDSVEGTSSTTSVLFGLFQVIDGSKYRILYIPFFTDKYTYFSDSFFNWVRFVTPDDRAYYKALEKTADADVVLYKSRDNESWGIPFLFTTKSVTWRGKAVRIKPDH